MKKITRNLKSILSVILAVAMLLAVPVSGFAATEAKENLLLSEFTESAHWNDSSNVRISGGTSGVRTVVDFSTVDATDTTHGDVLKYTYKPGVTIGGVAAYTNVWQHKSTNKKLSFDFYLYDNTVPYEIRLMGYDNITSSGLGTSAYIGQFNFNYVGGKITAPGTSAKVGIMEPGQASGAEKVSVNVTNKEWHKFDVIITEKVVYYYIDGIKIGEGNVPANTIGTASNNFCGLQVVSRADCYADTVGANSGLFVDNVRIHAYDDNSAFYGVASGRNKEITVILSETVDSKSTATFNSVKVYNTKTQQAISVGTPVFDGFDTLTIPTSAVLEEGVEYMIVLPTNVIGISGKSLNEVAYFTVIPETGVKQLHSNNLDSYGTLSDNNTDVLSLGGAVWLTGGFMNISDLSSSADASDAAHKKVMFVSNTSATASAYDYRGGIQFGKNKYDISTGEYAVEFDMKVPNTDYAQLFIQPYTYVEGRSDSEQMRVAINPSTWYDNEGSPRNQLCTLAVSSSTVINAEANTPKHPGWLQLVRNSDRALYAREWNNISYSGNAATYGYTVMDPKAWHTVKLVISKTDTDYAKVKLYLDDKYVTDNTQSTAGAGATDLLYGIRFSVTVPAWATSQGPFLYLDNVRVSALAPSERVEKIRMINYDGSICGPMSAEIKASAEKAAIYFTDDVNTTNATVTLTAGSDTITGTLSAFDETEKKVIATFDEVLKKSTTYTLKVSGVTNEEGVEIDEATAVFSTNETGEFIIEELKITDVNGIEFKDASEIAKDSDVYTGVKIINTLEEDKTAVVITGVYNDQAMTGANYKEYDLPSSSRVVVTTDVPVKVKDVTDLVVRGFVWEGLGNNKPLVKEVICD